MAMRAALIVVLSSLVAADQKVVQYPVGPQPHNFVGAGGFDPFGSSVASVHAYHGPSFDKGPIQAVGGYGAGSLGGYGASLGGYGASLGGYGGGYGGFHPQPQIIYVRNHRGRGKNRGKGGKGGYGGGKGGGGKGGGGKGDYYDYGGYDYGYDYDHGYDYDYYGDDKGKGDGGFMKGIEKGLKEMGKYWYGDDYDYDGYDGYAPPPKVVQAPPITAPLYGKGYGASYAQPALGLGYGSFGGGYGGAAALGGYGGGLGGYGAGLGGYGGGHQILAGKPQFVVPLNAHHDDYDYDYYDDEGYMSKAFKAGMDKMKSEFNKAYKGVRDMFYGDDYEEPAGHDPVLVVNSPVFMKKQPQYHAPVGPIPGYGLPGSYGSGLTTSYGSSYGSGSLGLGSDLKGSVVSSGLKGGIVSSGLSSGLHSTGLSSGLHSTGLSSGLHSTGFSSGFSGLSSGLHSTDLSSGLHSAGLSSGLHSAGLSSGLHSTGLSSGLVSSGSLSKGLVSTGGLSSGLLSSGGFSSGLHSSGLSGGLVSSGLKGATSFDKGFGSGFSTSYSAPVVSSVKSPAVSYGAPATSYGVPATTYGAPSISSGKLHDSSFAVVQDHGKGFSAGLGHSLGSGLKGGSFSTVSDSKGGLVSSYSSH